MAAPDIDELEARREARDTEDFSAFWSEQDRDRIALRNVYGVDLQLPASMPLRFDLEARRMARSQSEDDTRRMVGLLFADHAVDRDSGERLDGQALLDTWIERGMDLEQFGVLLMWGTANMRGTKPMTLAEARVEYKSAAEAKIAAALGKPAAQQESSRTRSGSSASTGRTSKRTSPASTGSRKKR